MALSNCGGKGSCTVWAWIVSAVLGVLAAFFQITGLLTVGTVQLWVAFAVAVGYLGILLLTAAVDQQTRKPCGYAALNVLLLALLGTILLSLILLTVDIAATSVLGTILVGLLVFFFVLIFVGTACYVRCQTNHES